MNIHSHVRVAVILFSTALLVGGCAADEVATAGPFDLADASGALKWATENGFDDVVAILEDGKVTAEEYALGHDLGRRCKEALGMKYGPATLDPISGTQLIETEEYRGATDESTQEAFDACDTRYFFAVETVYLDTTPQRMDPALLGSVRECLDRVGHPHSGDEVSFEDFYDSGASWSPQDPVAVCVLEQAQMLYPDLPSYSLGF